MTAVIFTKDSLRASVEAATGGKVTVLYDDRGYPSYMVVVPKFNLQDIDASLGSGTHPAFIVNGVEKSQLFIAQYQAIVADGRAVSMPGKDPATGMNFDQALGYCSAKGPGWHLLTNAEWAAIALWCWKNGFMPRGNNNYGQDSVATYETGARVDGGAPGSNAGTPRILTGSGPASWRHDNTLAGIADLNGNIWEWVGGLRLNVGEIQILSNNNAADNTKDQSAASAEWKGILADGSLVAPGTALTMKYDSVTAGTHGQVGAAQLNSAIANSNNPGSGDDGYTHNTFESLAAHAGLTAPALLKSLALFPVATPLGGDGMWARNYGERLPIRGGGWSDAGEAGVFGLALYLPRSYAVGSIGFRPAFVI